MDMIEIGRLIRDARKRMGHSQQALGAMIGMSRATISGLETGKITEVGIRKVIALCAALGLEVNVETRQRYPTLQALRQINHEQDHG